MGKGTLRAYEARQEGLIVRVGSDGRFSLPAVEDTTGLVVVHEQGYAHVPLILLNPSMNITLEAWGQVEGTLHIGRRLGTNEQVSLQSGNMAFGTGPPLAHEDFQARTDESGRFVIRFVPPGEQKITRMIPTGNGSWQGSPGTSIMVKPGVVTQVSLGGEGQTVVGKVHIAGPEVKYQNVHANLHNQLPEGFKKKRTPEEQIAWASTSEVKLAMKNYRSYTVIIAEDGSFRAEEVLPGKYDFELMVMKSAGFPRDPSDVLGRYHHEVVVSDPKVKDDTAPIDLGTIECEPVIQAAAGDH